VRDRNVVSGRCFHCLVLGFVSVMHFGSMRPVCFCQVCSMLLALDPEFRAEVLRASEQTWL